MRLETSDVTLKCAQKVAEKSLEFICLKNPIQIAQFCLKYILVLPLKMNNGLRCTLVYALDNFIGEITIAFKLKRIEFI